jgi:hypothetical protein
MGFSSCRAGLQKKLSVEVPRVENSDLYMKLLYLTACDICWLSMSTTWSRNILEAILQCSSFRTVKIKVGSPGAKLRADVNFKTHRIIYIYIFFNWVHSARRPLLAYCTCPWWLWGWRIWWNEDLQGKPKYSEKTYPSANLSTTNPTWPDPFSKPGRRGGKPATNRFSYGAACTEI